MALDWHSLIASSMRQRLLRLAWLLLSCSTPLLLVFNAGCGPSESDKKFEAMMEASKRQYSSSEVRTAVLPLFSTYYDRTIPNNQLPKEITSLALFAEDPKYILSGPLGTNSDALIFMTGSGFGHWGIVIFRFEDDQRITEWHRKRLIPWTNGIFFYRE
jgi:hypothetical protein